MLNLLQDIKAMTLQVQSVLDRHGNKIVDGIWNPLDLARLFRIDDIQGKRVLDMGANNGGLSLELARLGAIVHASEPVLDNTVAQEIANKEGLSVEWSRYELFDSHALPQFDVIACFGLVYHFRNPQYVLDYLSSLSPNVLYISNQTSPGKSISMTNRATTLNKNFYMSVGLRGWEPTHALFRRMLQSSGFSSITLLTDQEYDRLNHPRGLTNSAYYRAVCVKPVVDPESLNKQYEARWGEIS